MNLSPIQLTITLGTTLLALSAMGGTTAEERTPGETRVPLIYLMHYTPDATRNPAFVEQIRTAPPDILHLGHAVPLNSLFGPTADYTGFNPKLVPVAEILARTNELRDFVARLHQAGVKKVIPYINPSILGGEHESRRGFFAFYDHWDDYVVLGIGAKPARLPELWMQRDRRSFAPWEPEPNYTLWRYQPCPNEPAWRDYQGAVVRLIAQSGYDGVFVDDCIMECRHDLCAERFAGFLQSRHSSKNLKQEFGPDLALARGNAARSANAAGRLRNAETYLFWQNSVADLLEELNRAGRTVNPDFFTVPNWGASARVGGAGARARSGKSSIVWRRASTIQLLEEDHPAGSAGGHDVVSYLLQLNYGLALGIRPAVLSYGTTRGHVELGYAEAAAGGGGAYVESNPVYPEIRKKWRAFFESHQNLLAGFRLTAPVGLVFSMDEPRFGNDEHVRQVFAIARALYHLHIPFAAVPIENLTADQLAQHAVLIAPRVDHLSDSQVAQLKSFNRKGGRLLMDTACGRLDLLDQPRREPFSGAPLVPVTAIPLQLPAGKGAMVAIKSFRDLAPQREFALVDALDLRESKAFIARIKEIASKGADSEAENRFRHWIASLAGGDLVLAEQARDTHTVAYERLGNRDGALIVHAVRYATPTIAEEASMLQPAPLKLSIPLPSGWAVQQARVLSPEGPPLSAEAQVSANRVHCEVPPFQFYSMLHLQLQRSTK